MKVWTNQIFLKERQMEFWLRLYIMNNDGNGNSVNRLFEEMKILQVFGVKFN